MEKKISLANLPTKIEKLEKVSQRLGVEIYVKRDDQTGTELSGNKIRKLEYALYEAKEQGCDTVITCGGIQSNHARATAAACVKLGLKCILYLRSNERQAVEGNYFLDELLGAEVRLLPSDKFAKELENIMEDAASEIEKAGGKAYLIPVGASNAIGTLGYYHAFDEISEQEKELGSFDTLVCAVGSGGTYSGLHFANELHNGKKKVIGVPICDDGEYFRGRALEIWEGFSKLIGSNAKMLPEDMLFLDGYVGRGYALNTPEEMDFLLSISREEGIIFDSVYTGKAFRGLLDALETKHPLFKDSKRILFIHTGGLFGLFAKKFEFDFGMGK